MMIDHINIVKACLKSHAVRDSSSFVVYLIMVFWLWMDENVQPIKKQLKSEHTSTPLENIRKQNISFDSPVTVFTKSH